MFLEIFYQEQKVYTAISKHEGKSGSLLNINKIHYREGPDKPYPKKGQFDKGLRPHQQKKINPNLAIRKLPMILWGFLNNIASSVERKAMGILVVFFTLMNNCSPPFVTNVRWEPMDTKIVSNKLMLTLQRHLENRLSRFISQKTS